MLVTKGPPSSGRDLDRRARSPGVWNRSLKPCSLEVQVNGHGHYACGTPGDGEKAHELNVSFGTPKVAIVRWCAKSAARQCKMASIQWCIVCIRLRGLLMSIRGVNFGLCACVWRTVMSVLLKVNQLHHLALCRFMSLVSLCRLCCKSVGNVNSQARPSRKRGLN